MTGSAKIAKYVPGDYIQQRAGAAELAESYMREWAQRKIQAEALESQRMTYPTICFSRKIGVGALEVADILAEQIGYQLIDREILEHIANKSKLHQETVAIFDERYPGKIGEFLSLAFGEKAFIKNTYTRALFSAIYSIAGLKPTIFLGRGVHLLLPRDRVLAVRFVCSKEYRINRLAEILNLSEELVEKELAQIDKEQRAFFKSVYGKKDASPYEFDMVINRDYLPESQWATSIVALAFNHKFSHEINKA
jgi:cytidylate kinase